MVMVIITQLMCATKKQLKMAANIRQVMTTTMATSG